MKPALPGPGTREAANALDAEASTRVPIERPLIRHVVVSRSGPTVKIVFDTRPCGELRSGTPKTEIFHQSKFA